MKFSTFVDAVDAIVAAIDPGTLGDELDATVVRNLLADAGVREAVWLLIGTVNGYGVDSPEYDTARERLLTAVATVEEAYRAQHTTLPGLFEET